MEVFLTGYPRLCQEAAGRLRTLPDPADYPSVEEVGSRFTFSWQYVSYGVPEQLREISARMFQTERDKAVQAMSEACAEVQPGIPDLDPLLICVIRLSCHRHNEICHKSRAQPRSRVPTASFARLTSPACRPVIGFSDTSPTLLGCPQTLQPQSVC